ncbi:Aste57867_18519 [Aphanomyces stellatus]|uniref:Aste57867_18519 protein n=1 Tax=Aphanomyces stellatus TaxID=120398 RepID=A0A485LBT2_9STRA|nr:hypothetical protein As57867_018457 [Aphanomyces stellatus]VFT95255.1 Aste57867_18519 [Aphanomyces stellatus]
MKFTSLLTSSILASNVLATNITIIFPGNSGSEYTFRKPHRLPSCESNTWNIGGNTYDGITTCASAPSSHYGNNTAASTISVIPFRCGKYCAKPNARGITECDRCYYGWGQLVEGKIDPWWSEAEAAKGNETMSKYFVPQTISSLHNLRSCLMVTDKGLSKLCDRVVRKELNPDGAAATCIKDGKSTPFAKPLADNDECAKYVVSNNQVICQA